MSQHARDQLFEIAKDFHWEMGHRLPFHEGGCRNVHGHSYRLRLIVTGTLDSNGMVVDYFDLRRIVDPIVSRIDHAFLCDESDTEMLEFLEKHDMKRVVVPFPTTAENIAGWLLDQAKQGLLGYANITGLAVRLHETVNTYAEATTMMNFNLETL